MFAIRPSITFITRRRLLSTALSMSIIKTIPPTATVSKDTLPDLLYLLRCDMSEQVRHLKCKKMDVSIWEHLYSSKVNDQFSSWVAAGFNQRLMWNRFRCCITFFCSSFVSCFASLFCLILFTVCLFTLFLKTWLFMLFFDLCSTFLNLNRIVFISEIFYLFFF